MAVMTVNMLCGGLRDSELVEPKILLLKTGLDDGSEKGSDMFTDTRWRCATSTLCMQRESTDKAFAPLFGWVSNQVYLSLNLIVTT